MAMFLDDALVGVAIKKNGDADKYLDNLTKKIKSEFTRAILEKYGALGCEALAEATPKDTGLTADSWEYVIEELEDGKFKLSFINTNVVNYCSVALMLQYGHATKNGGWVEGRDYINPTLQPIFDEIREKVWKEMIEL